MYNSFCIYKIRVVLYAMNTTLILVFVILYLPFPPSSNSLLKYEKHDWGKGIVKIYIHSHVNNKSRHGQLKTQYISKKINKRYLVN